jgi:L-asparaginase/Glu-tRNA(Gln) amidotransferase subunit D
LALALAGWPARLAPRIPEVLICFGDVALRGNRAIKISTNSYQGFASPNLPPLARLGLGIQVETSLLRPRPPAGAAFAVHDRLEPAVMTVSLYPGITPGQLDAMLNVPDIAGYVLRCFGAGNAPGDPALLAAVGSAIMAGRVIVAITACPGGGVAPGLYAASHGLLAQGVIPGADLTEAAALTKLAWLLDHGGPAAALRLMARDCRGELTPG